MPALVLLWVWFCAYLNCAGWALSGLHQLNARGYAVALLTGFAALPVWRKNLAASGETNPSRPGRGIFHWRTWFRRFRRPFPLAFLMLAMMAFLGGALHAPNNY